MTIQRAELESELTRLLQPELFRDYCPNGMQVQGKNEISKLVTGVTASAALIESALDAGADCLLVHHGYFWKGEDQTITGLKKARVEKLLAGQLNLFAFHLPLDMHREFGNNAELGRLLGFEFEATTGRPGDLEIVSIGKLAQATTLQTLSAHIEFSLQRTPLCIGDPEQELRRVAWCTGAAQSYFDVAIAAGVDAFITGEISEPCAHLARESGVAFISAGHHATERYGVQAVGNYLAEQFDLAHQFIDIDNPA